MAKPLIIGIASIPVILAVLIAVPMITNPQIPFSATNADDKISIEYTKQHLKKISLGVTERITPQRTEILTISSEGAVSYFVTLDGIPQPEKTSAVGRDDIKKLIALFKETGFTQIPSDSIPPRADVSEYGRFSLKITLNGNTKQIQWVEQNATSAFVPPIFTALESAMHNVTKKAFSN